jgi:Fe-S cluster biogenesis protein NfuA
MKIPSLEITEHNGVVPVRGACTACPTTDFRVKLPTSLDREQAIESLKEKFDSHFKKVHLREDVSQAAARIVRQATEDK